MFLELEMMDILFFVIQFPLQNNDDDEDSKLYCQNVL